MSLATYWSSIRYLFYSTDGVCLHSGWMVYGKSRLSSKVRSENRLSSPTATVSTERGRIVERVEGTVLVGL